MHKRGVLVVLDGLDGAGKSLQIKLLKRKFKDIVSFSYPTKKTPKLRKYLNKKIELKSFEIFNLFLSDIINDQKNIIKNLKSGKIVVLDRYIFSTIAYKLKGISYALAKRIVKDSNILVPDIVIILDIKPNHAYERKKKQKTPDRYESDIKYLKQVRSNFLRLARERFISKNWIILDALKNARFINKKISGQINKKLIN
ncbi:MAG: dTMP kinase [Candidatus Micrarchaeia archaeon]|jgi:dTMP kinase